MFISENVLFLKMFMVLNKFLHKSQIPVSFFFFLTYANYTNPKDKKDIQSPKNFSFHFRIKNNTLKNIICSFHFNTIYLNTPRSFKEWRGKLKMGKYWEKTIQYPNCESSFGSQYNIKELQNSQHKEGLCLFFWCSCVVKLQLVVIGVACVAQRGLIQDCSRVLTTCNFIVSFR